MPARGSLSAYTVIDNQVVKLVASDLQVGERFHFALSMKGAKGVALVLEPGDEPEEEPTEAPIEEPTEAPTDEPTEEPTEAPTEEPTDEPGTEDQLVNDAVLWANADLYLTGKMPGNGVVEAIPVTVSIDGEEVIAAYDIKIYANEKQWEKEKPGSLPIKRYRCTSTTRRSVPMT